ncbi:MAG TPA: SEC-C metal-binding domain-containing protein [Candidatus Nanoarchaeia archaeon]|nr:SEC-C metal-binding domain-containing protein [Candidatus Nanoarchaeia archaeon]
MKKEWAAPATREIDMAWIEYFKDKPRPKTDKEGKKQLEEFAHWYNHVRKQSDTGQTPAEMESNTFHGFSIPAAAGENRMLNFREDKDYDEEIFCLVEDLKKYDNQQGYKLEYEEVKKRLDKTIQELIKLEEKALPALHALLEHAESWSCLFGLEIIKEIKSVKPVPYLVEFIVNNEEGDYFENCDIALQALVNIGEPAVDALIKAINAGLENKIFYSYLDEALSKIGTTKGNEFRNKILEDYLQNQASYKDWLNLTLFIYCFNENNQQSLPLLKKLEELELTEEEKLELKSAIAAIEDPFGYKKELENKAARLKILIGKKVGRNAPCPCGSGKKYKKCCLNLENM